MFGIVNDGFKMAGFLCIYKRSGNILLSKADYFFSNTVINETLIKLFARCNRSISPKNMFSGKQKMAYIRL